MSSLPVRLSLALRHTLQVTQKTSASNTNLLGVHGAHIFDAFVDGYVYVRLRAPDVMPHHEYLCSKVTR